METTTDWIGTSRAAEILGVTPRTMQNWLDQGRIQHWRTPGGGHRRMVRADVEAFLASAMKGRPFNDSHRGDRGDTVQDATIKKAFEAHVAIPSGMPLELDGRGQYDHFRTREAWDIWLASATWRMSIFRTRRIRAQTKTGSST
jgi:excisionase family DNA binding protein